MTREEAINIVQGARQYLTAGNPIWDSEKVDEAMKMAIEALSVDAVSLTGTMKYLTKPHNYCEVVRCKDCKYYDPDGSCDKNSGFCVNHDHDMDDDDFCSWGERKHG